MRTRIMRGPAKSTADKSNDESPRNQEGEDFKSERPTRNFRDHSDRQRRSFGEHSDRPRRSFGDNDERPRRSYGEHSDRPRRSFGDKDERPRRSFGDKDERPRRSFGDKDERPRRSYGERSDRPRRSFGDKDERPRRSFGEHSDRPRRSFGDKDERPRRSFGEHSDRPRRSFGDKDERPRRSFGERSERPRRNFTEQSERPEPQERPAPRVRGEKPIAKQPNNPDEVRLNKFIANSGICSRREADDYITAGLITVNGNVVTELGTKVKVSDDIRFNGERLKGEKKVYIIMNKPKNFVTTTSDSHAEKNVMELINTELCPERVFPVGRLDKNTTGVLLFTNDGALTEKLTHPSFERKKIYQVTLDKNLKQTDMVQLTKGVELEDGPIAADEIAYVGEKKDTVGVEIHSGRNRVVRRMFESLGYNVEKLDRVYFAGLTKKNIRRGQWRFLTDQEVAMLMMESYE